MCRLLMSAVKIYILYIERNQKVISISLNLCGYFVLAMLNWCLIAGHIFNRLNMNYLAHIFDIMSINHVTLSVINNV